jgi:hypothetical protein
MQLQGKRGSAAAYRRMPSANALIPEYTGRHFPEFFSGFFVYASFWRQSSALSFCPR